MSFVLSHKGFSSEKVTVDVKPSESTANQIWISLTSDAVYEEPSEDGQHGIISSSWAGNNQSYICFEQTFPSFKYTKNAKGYPSEFTLSFYERGEDNGYSYFESDSNAGTSITVTPEEVEPILKAISVDFYAFHKAQDESANLTIQKIRSLRVEDIVGEQGWEITKTTSRRGSRKN